MKYLYLFLFISCNKEVLVKKQTPVSVINTTETSVVSNHRLISTPMTFNVNNVNMLMLYGTLTNSGPGTINYEVNGVEHLIMTPSFTESAFSPIHFIKKNNQWTYEATYYDVSMGNARNYEKIETGTYAYADHGLELHNGQEWPQGHIWKVETLGDKLIWTQVSKLKSFYHSVSVGDFNNDGKKDIIGLHMGSRFNPWKNDGLHSYLNNGNDTYEEAQDLIEPINKAVGSGSVLSSDLDGDKIPEIIVAGYAFNPNFFSIDNRYTFRILKYNKNLKQYIYTKVFQNVGIFNIPRIGSTSIKSFDYDKDGDNDIAIAFEGEKNGIEIWENINNLDFKLSQSFGFRDDEMQFREFEISDINNDGFEDILLHPFHKGSKFYTTNGIKLENCIWINKKGKFEFYDKQISIPSIYPGFMKGFYIGGKLKFIGAEYNNINNVFKIHEVIINI